MKMFSLNLYLLIMLQVVILFKIEMYIYGINYKAFDCQYYSQGEKWKEKSVVVNSF